MIYIWAKCLPESAPLLLFQVQMFQFARKIHMTLGKRFFENQQSFRPRSEICKKIAKFQTFQLDSRVGFEKIVSKTALQQFRNIYLQGGSCQHFSKLVKTYQLFSVSPPASLSAPFPAPFPAPFQQVPSSLSTSLQHRFNIASTSLQHRFSIASTSLQHRCKLFQNASFNHLQNASKRFNSFRIAKQPPQHV